MHKYSYEVLPCVSPMSKCHYEYRKWKVLRIYQKHKSYHLWETGKTQNEIVPEVRCSPSAVWRITRLTCLKWSNYCSKLKATTKDERQLNRILCSNRFLNYGKISKAWNDAAAAPLSRYARFQRLQHLGYYSRILIMKPILTFKPKRKLSICESDHRNFISLSMESGHLQC